MRKTIRIKLIFIAVFLLSNGNILADTAVTLFQSYAGNINFVGAQATRRTQSNSGNACAVLANNATNTATISGIPAGATIISAHLYWAGSYSTQAGSTRTTPVKCSPSSSSRWPLPKPPSVLRSSWPGSVFAKPFEPTLLTCSSPEPGKSQWTCFSAYFQTPKTIFAF